MPSLNTLSLRGLRTLQALVATAVLAWGVPALPADAVAPVQAAPAAPAFITQAIGPSVLAGQGQMRFLGLRIYDARLWVGPQFQAQAFADYPLALQLTYHRAFRADAIAQRSVQEITRQTPLAPALAQRWQAQLAQWIPDVQPGDQLTGIYQPGQGLQLWSGMHMLGTVSDAALARAFVGIWLSPATSEPRLRQALLAGLPAPQP